MRGQEFATPSHCLPALSCTLCCCGCCSFVCRRASGPGTGCCISCVFCCVCWLPAYVPVAAAATQLPVPSQLLAALLHQ